ncbi:MAG: response regulator [Gammaproteobacteria bacterium]
MTLPVAALPLMTHRILLVDDDRDLASMLAEFMTHEGFEVSPANEGSSALTELSRHSVDIVVLDVMLPDRNGFEILKEIRRTNPRLPVIMLTARGEAIDRILGLELGADDYLAKPFDPRELTARLRAILRRATPINENPGNESLLQVGRMTLDLKRRRASIDSAPLELTGAEFRILHLLAEASGHPVERELLTERALGRKLTLYDRSIDTHVSNLRRKLERIGDCGVEIRAVRGTGYELIPAA